MTKLTVVAVALAVTAMAAAAAASPLGSIKLHPIDGGHWQARAGLPDSIGLADQGLVRLVDGSDPHPEAAAVTGLEGHSTSELESFGFTVAGEDVGIIPCIRIAYTDPDGNEHELMITSRLMTRTGGIGRGEWTSYRFDEPLPPGTIDAVQLAIHVESSLLEPTEFVFDNITVNDQTWTHPADNGL